MVFRSSGFANPSVVGHGLDLGWGLAQIQIQDLFTIPDCEKIHLNLLEEGGSLFLD
jgi:hypothetical protein